MPIYTESQEVPGGMKLIHRLDEDGTETWFPADKSNSDYQAYLAYLAEKGSN